MLAQYENEAQSVREVERVKQEKAAIEAEKQALCAQMATQQQEFDATRESLGRQLQELERKMWHKEDTIQKLLISEQEARTQSQQYLVSMFMIGMCGGCWSAPT